MQHPSPHQSDGADGSVITRQAVELPGGVEMPLLGLGTWQLTGRSGYRAVRYALDVGYRHLDTATMYRNEAEVGRAVRDSGVPREDVFITTKLPPRLAGQEAETLAASLRALGTGYVDLWLIHWPPGGAAPAAWRRFITARRDGLARAIGVSNYSTGQLDDLTGATGVTPAVNQIEWGPSRYDAALLAEHRRRGVVVEGYSPFKNSNLRHATLTRIARQHGVTSAQVVIRWHIQHGIVVIPKSAQPERIRRNADVAGFSLSDREIAEIDAMSGH